jgi:hypothetical protein
MMTIVAVLINDVDQKTCSTEIGFDHKIIFFEKKKTIAIIWFNKTSKQKFFWARISLTKRTVNGVN